VTETAPALLLGTRNPAKLRYYTGLFSALRLELLAPESFGIDEAPEETGQTAEQNAEIKARFYAHRSGVRTLAEDEVLYVDFLAASAQPGVLGRSPGDTGEMDDASLLAYWADLVSRVTLEKRTGHWHIAYSIAWPGGEVRTTAVDYPVRFFLPPSSTLIPGWPLSSIQGRATLDKPYSDLTEEDQRLLAEIDGPPILSGLGLTALGHK
jgi:inosine/xanthosine triphosphate pyrophosphatase family protein